MSSRRCRVMGRCKKEIQRCTCSKRVFLCRDCHQVNDKGYLVRKDSKPEYDGDSRPCNWKGRKSSYPKHNRRYHGSGGNGEDLIGFRKSDSGHIHKQCLKRLRGRRRKWSSWRSRRRGQQNFNDVQYLEDVHNSQKEQITNLQKQLDDKSNTFKQLNDLKQSEIAQLKEEKNSLEKERQNLNEELIGLKQEMSKLLDEEIEHRNEYERKIQNLNDKNAAINEESTGSKQEMNTAKTENKEMKLEINNQKEQITHLQQQLDDKNNAFKQLTDLKQSEMNNLEKERQNLNDKHVATNEELIALKQEISKLEREISKISKLLDDKTENETKSATEKQELRNEIAAINEDLIGSKQEINKAKTENKEMNLEINAANNNLQNQKEQITNLQQQLHDKNNTFKQLEDANKAINQELIGAKQENGFKQTEIAKLKAKNNELEKDTAPILNEATNNQQNQKQELRNDERKVQNSNDKNAAIKQELIGSKQEINEAKTENKQSPLDVTKSTAPMDNFKTVHRWITISDNGKTVTSNGMGRWGNAYGSTPIKSSSKHIYKWRLTCKKLKKSRKIGCVSMYIGIQSNTNLYADWKEIDYGYNGSDGNKLHLGKKEKYGTEWNSGDVIEMRVDFERQEMGYSVNGSDQGIAFRNIQLGQTYYLVVRMNTANKGESIFLNDFNEILFKEEKENGFKQTEIAELKEKNSELEKERQNLNANNIEMNQEISKLKQQINKLKQLDDEKEMELENYLLPTKNAILKEAMDNQQNQKKELDDKNKAKSATEKEELTNEYERKQELIGSKQETNEAKTENLDYALWRQWDSKKVFYFIMNAVNDGSLKPYQESIKKEIFESQYTGKDLAEIEFDHIQSMGIKNISMRRAVFNEIQKLIQNKSQMNELPKIIKEFPQRRQLRTFNKYYMIFCSFLFLFFFIDTLYLRQFLNLSF